MNPRTYYLLINYSYLDMSLHSELDTLSWFRATKFTLTPQSYLLSEEEGNTNYIVFDLTPPVNPNLLHSLTIQLSVLVKCKVDILIIIISLNINWSRNDIAERLLIKQQPLTHLNYSHRIPCLQIPETTISSFRTFVH
jgi:hypothetical protein